MTFRGFDYCHKLLDFIKSEDRLKCFKRLIKYVKDTCP